MSRKDYELIASVLREARTTLDAGEGYPPLDAETIKVLTRRLGAALAADNDAFNLGRFLKASGDLSGYMSS